MDAKQTISSRTFAHFREDSSWAKEALPRRHADTIAICGCGYATLWSFCSKMLRLRSRRGHCWGLLLPLQLQKSFKNFWYSPIECALLGWLGPHYYLNQVGWASDNRNIVEYWSAFDLGSERLNPEFVTSRHESLPGQDPGL